MQYQRRKYTETPGGVKASVRPRSASARGGSSAAPGKRSVFPKRVNAPTIISDYVAVYRFCVNNNNLLVGRIIGWAILEKTATFDMTSCKRYFQYYLRSLLYGGLYE